MCLQYYNFGVRFIKGVHALYPDPFSRIVNNGHVTDPVKLSRGVRQGCPLSAYLFFLVTEILAVKIRTEGLVINGLESKACFCEDDANPSM